MRLSRSWVIAGSYVKMTLWSDGRLRVWSRVWIM
jgi:hypothetical protein